MMKAGSVDNWTEYQTFTTDFIPDAPTGLIISGNTGDNPVLTWNANSEPDLYGYNVYRNIGTGDNKLNTNPISSTTYTDPVTIVKFDGVSTSYFVKAIDNDMNESSSSNTASIQQNTVFPLAKDSVNSSESISTVTSSSIKSFPNPFNPETNITFQLKDDSYVNMQIFNIRGQLVRSLVNNNIEAGQYTLKWDSKDDIGRDVPSGVYLCCIDAENFHKSIKLLLVR